MNRRVVRRTTASVICLLVLSAQPRAWDPWNNIVKPAAEGLVGGVKAVGGFVGGIVGAPFGGLVGSMAQPTIDSAEAAGHRIVAQMDSVMSEKLTKLDQIADKQIGNLDLRLEKRLVQFDSSLDARIKQIDATLGARLDQVNLMMTTSIAEVDARIKERLDQLDEIAATRIGTLDVVATKAALTFEQGMIRVVGAACILVFVGAALWILYGQLTKVWVQSPNAKVVTVLRSRWRSILAQELGVAAVVACLFALIYILPGSARRQADAMVADQDAAYARALAAMDFQQARFHAALMQAIDSSNSGYRAKFLKAELLRDLFTRVGLLSSVGGLNTVVFRVNQIESLGDANDPDLKVIKAFVLWQSGMTKSAEVEAATLCASALEQARNGTVFPLRPLALNYVLNYGARPDPAAEVPRADAAELAEFDRQAVDTNVITPLTYMFRYDGLVRRLDATVSTEYARLIDSHGEFMAASRLADAGWKASALKDRTAHADQVVAAWDTFINRLKSDPILSDSPSRLAPFLLNDAMYLRALWYSQDTDGSRSLAQPAVAPAVAVGVSPLLDGISVELRKRLPRVRLADRLTIFDTKTRDVVDSEEYRRFRSFEGPLAEFEQAQTIFLMALHQNGRQNPGEPVAVVKAAAAAANKASAAQLWSEHRPYASAIRARLENVKKVYWDERLWAAVEQAEQDSLKERSLKLM